MWRASAPEIRIVGDGSLRDELKNRVATAPDLPIRFLGQVSAAEAQDEISHARLLVLPSEWFERFPMVVRESFAFGTPAAVSKIGPLPSIVEQGQNGVVFTPADPESLLGVARTAWETEGELRCMGAGARESFEALYTEDANYRILFDIYGKAIDVSKRRKMATH